MAKVRAYKIAAELNIDKEELVRRAAEVGIELRSAMVGLDEEQAEELRRKLGGGAAEAVVEKRVRGGVIRRRRKVEPEPVEAPPEEEPAVGEEAPAVAAETEEPEPVAAEAEVAPEAEAPEAPPQVPPAEEAPPLAAEAPAAAEAVEPGPAPERAAEPERPRPVPSSDERSVVREPGRAAPRRQTVRRQVVEQVSVREQDRLARQLRGNIQSQLERRRLLVERQSREQSRRRRPSGGARKAAPARERKKKILRVAGPVSFQELSRGLGVKVHELIRRAQALDPELDREALVDLETAELLAGDLGFEVQVTTPDIEGEIAARSETAEEDLEPRPPVVTVMGHVDHGKTSLLDYIRSTNVAAGEAGGITQHIGAYSVEVNDSSITFLDTPGHAAFTQMRARGAQVTDIAVLVVAADDGVMPQTVEAISHARAAGVPIIVAVNKIDLPNANPQRVKQGLLEHQLVPEEFGGDTICVEVSAKAGTNVDKLLEMLALQAEILELKARRKGKARGVVVEAQLDRGRGPVATVLVNEGTLKRGDALVVGTTWGRVRALSNHRGEAVKQALPSEAVQIVGLQAVPEAGDEFVVTKNEREAKQVAEHRIDEQRRPAAPEAMEVLDADALFAQLGESDKKQLAIILKADVRGTMEAARDSLQELSTERVTLEVIHAGVGAINESDVDLAAASSALIVGFNVRPEPAARKTAERDGVEIRTFEVIHEMLDEVKAAMTGLLPPKRVEKIRGHAEVRKLFTIPKVGTIAGCLVPDGGVHRSDRIRVVRDGVTVYVGRISSLRHYKDDVREIQPGSECGIGVENFNDVKVGDILEAFVVEETPDTL